MIKYILEGNTVKAEFDWAYNYTCPQAQWQVEIRQYLEKRTHINIHVIAEVVEKVVKRKTVFYGKAKVDAVTTLGQAKEYAKQNLLDKYIGTVYTCINELYWYLSDCKKLTHCLMIMISDDGVL